MGPHPALAPQKVSGAALHADRSVASPQQAATAARAGAVLDVVARPRLRQPGQILRVDVMPPPGPFSPIERRNCYLGREERANQVYNFVGVGFDEHVAIGDDSEDVLPEELVTIDWGVMGPLVKGFPGARVLRNICTKGATYGYTTQWPAAGEHGRAAGGELVAVDPGPMWCRNGPSLETEDKHLVAAALLYELVKRRYMVLDRYCVREPGKPDLKVGPLGAIPRSHPERRPRHKRMRLLSDASRGSRARRGPDALNAGVHVDRPPVPVLKLPTAGYVIRVLRVRMQNGQQVWMATMDVSDAFRMVRVRPADWHLAVVWIPPRLVEALLSELREALRWPGDATGRNWWGEEAPLDVDDLAALHAALAEAAEAGTGLFLAHTALPLGVRSSPVIWCVVSEACSWALAIRHYLAITYIDDSLIVADGCWSCLQAVRTLGRIYEDVGLEVNLRKLGESGMPDRVAEFCGIVYNTLENRVYLREDKRYKLVTALQQLVEAKWMPLGQIRSLAGKMAWAASVYRLARPGAAPIYKAAGMTQGADKRGHAGLRPNHARVKVTGTMREGARHFMKVVSESSGVHIVPPPRHPIHMTSDASGSVGYGATCGKFWLYGSWTKWEKRVVADNVAVGEAFAVLLALRRFRSVYQGSGATVVFHVDNAAVVAVLQAMRARDARLQYLVQRIADEVHAAGITLEPRWISTKDNVHSDMLSRGLIPPMLPLYSQAHGLHVPTQVDNRLGSGWQYRKCLWGPRAVYGVQPGPPRERGNSGRL